jgi:hypothetical protein
MEGEKENKNQVLWLMLVILATQEQRSGGPLLEASLHK